MKKINKIALVLIAVALIVQGIPLMMRLSASSQAEQPPENPQATPEAGGGFKLFMPWLRSVPSSPPNPNPTPTPPPPTEFRNVFGIESYYYGDSTEMDFANNAGMFWLRRNALIWKDVETSEGARNWSAMSAMEPEFTNASSLGKKIVLIVRATPTWARLYSNQECGRMKDSEIAAFANFMYDVVKRYSAPPYNVMYYEIWNEPEALYKENYTVVYGCWGNSSESYYGGRHYAQVLKQVYPKMKSANSNIKVLLGGFVLDCDPVNPPAGKDCSSTRYFEGILAEGGGPYFDIVSYHSYDYYQGALGFYSNSNWNSASNTTGPTLAAKVNYVRNLLSSYNITGKEIMATEVALICKSSCDSTFQETKSYFVAETYAASIVKGLAATNWYHLYDVWENTGLISTSHVPHPAYNAYKYAQQRLGSSKSGRDISTSTFFIYEIETPKGNVWLMWSKDMNNHSYSFNTTPKNTYNVYGSKINPAKTMTIGVSPVYVDWFTTE